MSYIITEMNNFGRILRLPVAYPEGYCFGGGHQVQCQLVDWFYPIPPKDGKFFNEYPRTIEEGEMAEIRQRLRDFIKDKVYVKSHPNHKFIMVTDYGDAFMVYDGTALKAMKG
jgi:hypothetical protein